MRKNSTSLAARKLRSKAHLFIWMWRVCPTEASIICLGFERKRVTLSFSTAFGLTALRMKGVLAGVPVEADGHRKPDLDPLWQFRDRLPEANVRKVWRAPEWLWCGESARIISQPSFRYLWADLLSNLLKWVEGDCRLVGIQMVESRLLWCSVHRMAGRMEQAKAQSMKDRLITYNSEDCAALELVAHAVAQVCQNGIGQTQKRRVVWRW